jgi:ATP-dependent Lon protease
VEKRYADLCQVLNIRAYPHLSKAQDVLGPSLDELVAIGYLEDWDLVRSSQGKDFKLLLSPGKRLLSLEHFAGALSQLNAQPENLPLWISELVSRGVAERKARQLALDIPQEQPVLDQIEYAEHLLRQDSNSRRKIANPAGFIIWAIESNLTVPETFQTSRQQKTLELQDQAHNEQRQLQIQMEYDYEEYCRNKVREKIQAEYPEERLKNAIREQMRMIRHEQTNWYERVSDAMRTEVALARIHSLVRESMQLPTFERWTKQEPQKRLF